MTQKTPNPADGNGGAREGISFNQNKPSIIRPTVPREASGRRRARSYQTPIRKALSRDSQGRASGPLGAALDAAITQGE